MHSSLTKANFFNQIQVLIDKAGPVGIFALCIGLLFFVILGLMGKKKALICCYLISVMFSGFAVESIDSGFRIFRWFVLFVLALTIYKGMKNPGISIILFVLVSTYGIFISTVSIAPFYSFQQAVLMWVLMALVVPSISADIKYDIDINTIMKFLLIATTLWSLLALVSLSNIRQGERFSGAITGAPVFVMTGGLLMPAMLWGLLSFENRSLRYYSGILFIIIILMCIVSGQRTGSFAGFIACLPLLLQPKLKKLMGILVISGFLILIFSIFISFLTEQKFYIMDRFFSTDVSGRQELWARAWQMTIDEPWFGHGFGMAIIDKTIFHNSFLSYWYNAGILSMILVIVSVIWLFIKSFFLMIRANKYEIKNIGRYCMGISLGIAAASFFEQTLDSPSNFTIFTYCLACIFSVQCSKLIKYDNDIHSKEIDYGCYAS